MTDRELMQMALDAMESFESGTNGLYKGEFAEERKALRNRLAQPEPEPVAWLTDREAMYFDKEDAWRDCGGFIQPLYTAPPKREWVGLTDEDFYGQNELQIYAMKYAEAKLKEKNT